MTRFQTKYSKVAFGWETSFRKINATYDHAVSADTEFDFTLNFTDIDLSDAKPKYERTQKHYVGKASRLPTGTYEGEFKNGSLSISGDLKHGHIINSVLGTMTAANNTSSDGCYVHQMYEADRPSFFVYTVKGSSATEAHAQVLLGCKTDDLTIEGKEGSEITFDLTALVAKRVNCATIYDIPAAIQSNLDRTPYFHFKHAAINLTIGSATYTSTSQNQVERFKINFKQNSAYKHGAPASGGQLNANYDKEGAFDVELELDIYPEDNVLWEISPSDAMYQEIYASSTIALTITLAQTSNTNTMIFNFTDLEVDSVSEKIPAIEDNIVPATVVLKPATYSSTISALLIDMIDKVYYNSA